jgi:hypothetical protein
VLEAATAFNEDAPVLISLVIGGLIGERVLRKYAQPPLDDPRWSHPITWGIAAALMVVYVFWIKPRLY